ncbi:hypothetical protein D9M71_750800 [compost metagenome]
MKIDFAKLIEAICIVTVSFFVGLDTYSSVGVATMFALFTAQEIRDAIKGAKK